MSQHIDCYCISSMGVFPPLKRREIEKGKKTDQKVRDALMVFNYCDCKILVPWLSIERIGFLNYFNCCN